MIFKKSAEERLTHVVEEARKLKASPGFRWGLMAGAAITVAIGFFIFQNGERTDLEFLWADFESPLWVGLLVSYLAGAITGPLFVRSWRRHREQRREQKVAEKEIRKAAKKINIVDDSA